MSAPIDFGALVLGPAMAAFGQPATVTPTVSQPGGAAYAARGIYASKKINIELEHGGFFSTVQPSLGVQLSAFPVAPMVGDQIDLGLLGKFEIADVTPDGQGGADLVLRDPSAVTATTIEDGA